MCSPVVGLADRDALYAAQLAECRAARNPCLSDWQARDEMQAAEACHAHAAFGAMISEVEYDAQLAEFHAARNYCNPD